MSKSIWRAAYECDKFFKQKLVYILPQKNYSKNEYAYCVR